MTIGATHGDSTADELYLMLPASPMATREARHAITDHWTDLGETVVDDLLVVVTELVGNAVRHGEPAIELRIRAEPVAIDVSVLDHGPGLPPAEPMAVSPEATSGRGLTIIDALANSWGVSPLPDRVGKTVWATLSRQPG